jgi:hypothetical protein
VIASLGEKVEERTAYLRGMFRVVISISQSRLFSTRCGDHTLHQQKRSDANVEDFLFAELDRCADGELLLASAEGYG